MTQWMDLAQKIVRGEVPPPPVLTLVGMKFESVAPGRAVATLEASERHSNPMGTVHGGILCDLADAAMGLAWASELDDGETFTTLELKINFLKPVRKGRLRAEAQVVKRGNTTGLIECSLWDETGDLVARASSTTLNRRG